MSKTQQNKLSIAKLESCGVCCRCIGVIPKVKDKIAEHTDLLPELINIVMGFYECPKPYVGYVVLHTPTRRRNHVVCLPCHEVMVKEGVRVRDMWVVCPERNCSRHFDILDVHPNTVDDYYKHLRYLD